MSARSDKPVARAGQQRRSAAAPSTTRARITVSLPGDLFVRGEEERAKSRVSRSEFVATLYRRFLDDQTERERVARYAAAYATQPESEDERAWAEAGLVELVSTLERDQA